VLEANKAVVRRLVDEVLNGGHLELIDELYAPELATGARRWITPFRASFPDVHMEIVDLIAEADKVVDRFTCSATHLGEWLGQAPTGRRFERVDEVSIFRMRDGRIVHAWSLDISLPGCGNWDSRRRKVDTSVSDPCQLWLMPVLPRPGLHRAGGVVGQGPASLAHWRLATW
jgi:hypothetical protein